MNESRRKFTALLLGAAGLVALLLLAAGLPQIRFHDSLPLPGIQPSTPSDFGTLLPGSETFFLVFGLIILFLVPISILFLLMSPEGRKRLITHAIQILLILIFAYFASRNLDSKPLEPAEPPAAGALGDSDRNSVPPENSPEWLVWVLSLTAAGMLLAGGYQIWARWQSRGLLQTPTDDLASSASQALADLRDGKEFKEVILRCYQQMVEIAAADKQLPRPEFVTPGEFIAVLKSSGLPAQAVEQLTHLFEFARYSLHPATPAQNAEAVACLEAITQTLQRPT